MPETAEELSKKPEVRQELARAGDTRAVRLVKKLLAALNAEPDKVLFPAGANR